MARKKTKKPADRQGRWREAHPWARLVEHARRRCGDRKSKWWPYYGAKGITVEITAKQLEPIWRRDNAHLLKRPSLDRIDTNKSYTIDNVRIIEFNSNARMALDESFKFLFDGQQDTPPLPDMANVAPAPTWVTEAET